MSCVLMAAGILYSNKFGARKVLSAALESIYEYS